MMTLAWKRTFAEWARFSKAVISVGEKWENLSNVLVREQASLVTMLLCSPYFSDVCKGQQGMKEIRFGANRSWCFLKHSKMRWDSDCQRYWVYLRTNAYLSLHEVLVNVLDAGVYVRACVRACVCVCARARARGAREASIMALYSAMRLVRKRLTSASSSTPFLFLPAGRFSLCFCLSFLVPFQYKRKYRAHSSALLDGYI